MISKLKKYYLPIFEELLIPNERHKFVWDMDLEVLKQKGFSCFILDLDNTILSHDQRELTLQHLTWIEKCKDMGFDIYLFSNNRSKKRVQRVCEQIECYGYYACLKPFVYSFDELIEEFDVDCSTAIVVGDQLFKDVVIGNYAKVYSVLVDPIDTHFSFSQSLLRKLELYCLDYFKIKFV